MHNLRRACRFKVNRQKHLDQCDPVFLRPIENGYDALPVGNGDLAAIVWQPDHLTWMLNKCDLSMEASQAARLVFETPAPLASRLGRLETRLSLADATVTVRYTGGELGPGVAPATDGSGELIGTWRGESRRSLKPGATDLGSLLVTGRVPHGRNALLIEFEETTPTPHAMRIRLERWIQPAWGGKVTAAIRDGLPIIEYELSDGSRYAAAMAFEGFAGAVASKTGPIQLALDVPLQEKTRGRLAIAVVTSHAAGDPLGEAMGLARETLAADPKAIERSHRKYWTGFRDKSFVDSGHPYANMLYHMALYELAVTSRGRRPVKFNGGLNLWNENERMWGGPFWCHNQHSIYLPVYAANHSELAENFLEWIARVRPETLKAARKYFGVEGAYYPEIMERDFRVRDPEKRVPERDAGDLPFHWEMKYILSSGVRYASLLWDRYRYTLDEAFLMEKAYPVLRDTADFYVRYGKPGKDGRYHVEPALCWETPPLGRDSHADCAAWRAIFAFAIEAAGLLGVDQERVKTWNERLRKAPPYPVEDGSFSVVTRTDGTPEPTDHWQWQDSNLAGIFPFGVIGLGSPSALRKTATETFARYRFNADAGHEYLPLVAARLGLAEDWRAALFQFVQFFQVFDQGLFNYYSIAGNKDEETGNRQLLQPYLEASGIFAASINEMLLQSHDGTIRVFPVAPERWKARFILRAAGSFLVASEHRGREGVPYVLIEPVGGAERDCKMELPWAKAQGARLVAENRAVPFRLNGRQLVFRAKPGVVYALTPRGKRLEDVPIARIEPCQEGSPARLGMTWYGLREGGNVHSDSFPLW